MLSDRKKPKEKLPKKLTNFSDAKKIELARLWLTTGNLAGSSRVLGIHERTAYLWQQTNWWKKLIDDLKTEGVFKLRAKTAELAEKALGISLDRLENGDWIYDQKTGELRRKPVTLKDAHKVAMDSLAIAHKTEPKPVEEKTEQHLAQLADAFANFARKTHKIEVIDAISNEREEGLQSRSEVGEASSPETDPEDGEDEGPTFGGEGGEGTQGGQPPSGSHQAAVQGRIE